MPTISNIPYIIENGGKPWSFSQSGDVSRFEVHPGDKWSGDAVYANPKERSEISTTTKFQFNQVYTLEYKFMIEPGAPNTSNWMYIGQIHATPDAADAALGPPVGIQLVGDRLEITVSSDAKATQTTTPPVQTLFLDSQNITRGQWYDITMQVKFDPSGGGMLNVFKDGVQIVNYTGPLGYNDAVGPYWKEGIYRGPSPNPIAVDYKGLDIETGQFNKAVTATSGQPLSGTAGADHLGVAAAQGGATGGAGSVVQGLGGDDVLVSGPGNDTLDGGAGNDTAVFSQAYGAYATASSAAATTVSGPDGTDTLIGVEMLTFADRQVIVSTAGQTLTARAGADILVGGAGADTFVVKPGNDVIDGGAGSDTVIFSGNSSAYTIGLNNGALTVRGPDGTDTLTNVESLRFADSTVLASSITSSTLGGQTPNGAGALNSGSGGATLTGNAGNDTLNGGAGNDTLTGNAGNDVLNGGAGIDTAVFSNTYAHYAITTASSGATAISGPDGNDTLTNIEILRFADRQMVITSAGETLTARAGSDTLVGGTGDDTLVIGSGTDKIYGGAGSDIVLFSGAYSTYTVSQSAGVVTVNGPGGTTDTLNNVETLHFADQTVSVASLASPAPAGQTLTGGAGADVLTGGAGADILKGGAGQDTLTGGAGNDAFVFGALADTAVAHPDTITDFVSGQDRIDVSAIDPHFHLGSAAGAHTIVVNYDAAHDRTVIDLYVTGGSTPGAEIWLTGAHALNASDFLL